MESLSDLELATMRARDRAFSEFLVVSIGLAASTNPELLRQALGQVFDLSAVEETTKRIMGVVTAAQQSALEVRYLIEQVHREVDELEQRLDQLREAFVRIPTQGVKK